MENNTKKWERARTNRVVAGVCAGLADYFSINVALMRVLFVVATICGSFGFWLYIILWIVAPEENVLGQGYAAQDASVDITPNEIRQKTNNGALIASLVLIFIGIIALLDNFVSVTWIWKLWPVTLIMVGVVIIVKSQQNKNNEQ